MATLGDLDNVQDIVEKHKLRINRETLPVDTESGAAIAKPDDAEPSCEPTIP
jgi:hypothetical protein